MGGLKFQNFSREHSPGPPSKLTISAFASLDFKMKYLTFGFAFGFFCSNCLASKYSCEKHPTNLVGIHSPRIWVSLKTILGDFHHVIQQFSAHGGQFTQKNLITCPPPAHVFSKLRRDRIALIKDYSICSISLRPCFITCRFCVRNICLRRYSIYSPWKDCHSRKKTSGIYFSTQPIETNGFVYINTVPVDIYWVEVIFFIFLTVVFCVI
jgi:hypothetical protein